MDHTRAPRGIPWGTLALGFAVWTLVFAVWTDLPARFAYDISHDRNEDWDWQLTFYEVCRLTLLRFGQVPLWSPYTQGGVPMLANPESPFLYPGFLLPLALGTGPGLRLWIVVHLGLAGAGAAGLAARSGIRPWVALLAPIPWLMAAFLTGFLAYGHIMFLAVAWLPWVLLLWPRRPGPDRQTAAAALLLAMTFLMGGHYVFLYGLLLLGLTAAWRLPLGAGARAVLMGFLALDVALTGLRDRPWAPWMASGTGVALLAALAVARVYSRTLGRRALAEARTLAWVAVPAVLLTAIKLVPGQLLLGRAERLTQVPLPTAQDRFDLARLAAVMLGRVERPSGHEGQEVYGSALPLGLLGLAFLVGGPPGRRWAAGALFFLGLSLADNLPVDYASVLHRLPGFALFRVTERYTLVYSLMVGLAGAAAMEGLLRGAERLPRVRAVATPLASAVLLSVQLAWARDLWRTHDLDVKPGARPVQPLAPAWGAFHQASSATLTNFDSARANQGRVDCWTTAWLGRKAPGLRARGEEGYRGEVWAEDGATVGQTLVSPNRIHAVVDAPAAGAVVQVNQNALPGWLASVDAGPWNPAGGRDDILAVPIPAGRHTLDLVYRPPGLAAGAGLSLAGLGLLAWSGRRR